jgi:hypothetical protein
LSAALRLATSRIRTLLERKKGVLLDISLGGPPQERSVSMRRGGDIAHSPLRIPFPLPDACVHTAVVTHVLEYLDGQFFQWWDELHRVMQPNGVVYVSGPYGGDESHGWLSDPQHRTRVVEQTFAWLDPRTPVYALHDDVGRPRPKPWHPLTIARVPGTHGTLSYNVTLVKPKASK